MKKILNNLADSVLSEMNKMDCSYAYFADFCGISRNEISDIVRRKKNDLRLSTLDKICKNSGVLYIDIFEYSDSEIFEKMIKNYYLTDGNNNYFFQKLSD